MLENDNVDEECEIKYRDTVVTYDVPMDQIESKLRTFKEMEKQNESDQ